MTGCLTSQRNSWPRRWPPTRCRSSATTSLEAGICGEAELDRIDNEALATVEAALQTVMSADSPSVDELDRDVYATPIKFPV